MTSKEAWSNCFTIVTWSPTLVVYCDIISTSSHAHKQFSCTKPLPRGTSVQWMWYYLLLLLLICGICGSNSFAVDSAPYYVLVHLAQLFILFKYHFAMCWNWQMCHTHKAFKLPLRTLSGKPQTFLTSEIKDKWISSQSNQTVQSTSLLENS